MDPIDFEIKLGRDGDAWCALIGENLQEGTAGYGNSAGDALRDLANACEISGLFAP